MSEIEIELAELARSVSERQREIEGKAILIEVLEHDGHDVSEQEMALKKDRSELAVLIAQQFELIKKSVHPAD
nr:hypothetical protein HAU86_03120 [Bradyrhizobium symbiodeficiens]